MYGWRLYIGPCANDIPGDSILCSLSGRETDVHIESELRIIARTHKRNLPSFFPFSFVCTQKGTKARTATRLPNANLNGVLHIGFPIQYARCAVLHRSFSFTHPMVVAWLLSVSFMWRTLPFFFFFFLGRTSLKMFAFFHRSIVDEMHLCVLRTFGCRLWSHCGRTIAQMNELRSLHGIR